MDIEQTTAQREKVFNRYEKEFQLYLEGLGKTVSKIIALQDTDAFITILETFDALTINASVLLNVQTKIEYDL